MTDRSPIPWPRATMPARWPARSSRPCRMLPPVADDLPAGVSGDDLLWEETIAAGGYATRRLAARLAPAADRPAGRCLRLAADLQRRDAERTAQCRRYGEGAVECLSRRRQAAAVRHGPRADEHPGRRRRHARRLLRRLQCRDQRRRNMAKAATAAPFPTGATACCSARPSTGCNAATSIPASTCSKARGSRRTATITPLIGPFEPGRSVILRAEMDVIVVIANCPHVLDPRERLDA